VHMCTHTHTRLVSQQLDPLSSHSSHTHTRERMTYQRESGPVCLLLGKASCRVCVVWCARVRRQSVRHRTYCSISLYLSRY